MSQHTPHKLCTPAFRKARGLWAARAAGGRQPVYGCRCRDSCPTLWIKTAYGFSTISPMNVTSDPPGEPAS